MTLRHRPEPPGGGTPSTPVHEWAAPGRGRAAALQLVLPALWLWSAGWPGPSGLDHPLLRVLQLGGGIYLVVAALLGLRVRVLLEQDGLVVVRAFHRIRIPWDDMREVRVRGRAFGRGWVEVVRRDLKEVVLPAPVEMFPVLEERWLAHRRESRPGAEDAAAPAPKTGRPSGGHDEATR